MRWFKSVKRSSIIPPGVALVIGGGWLTWQHLTVASLETETARLQQRIAAARLPDRRSEATPAKSGLSAATVIDHGPIDWKSFGAGPVDSRTIMALSKRMDSMTQGELVAALDEIFTLDLPADRRPMLEQLLLRPLIRKDPELALTRYVEHLAGPYGALDFPLSDALREWAKRDAGKATAWFDQQVVAGTFAGKGLNDTRLLDRFQGGMIRRVTSMAMAFKPSCEPPILPKKERLPSPPCKSTSPR